MQVSIIGAGNVATVLGRELCRANKVDKVYKVAQVYARDAVSANQLAAELGAEAITDLGRLDGGSDLYMVAVTDEALPEVAAHLQLKDQLLIHTAGSVPKGVLQHASTRYGVLWPMKMIREDMPALGPVTMVVDGSSEEVTRQVEELAAVFTDTLVRADDEMRLKMHLVAAFTANFSNHLYHLAADFCAAEKIDFGLFYPIIEATVQNLLRQHPAQAQAGPAFRGDRQTEEKHLVLLEQYPQAKQLYQVLSNSIRQSFRG
ncbi:MAG: DUF2520 domain-containing protein [Chitinophagaceae bacterium]|nr:MAG: DUF2520 domain-containing protein [Chitinophagaceae bacterium]